MSADPRRPRVTFGIIVLNGEPFTRYTLRALYPYAHEIIVAEGAAPGAAALAAPDGHSSDGTLDVLREFARHDDPEGKLTVVTAEDEGHPDGFWPGEKDEQSRAYASRATGDFLWQVDVDEFYLEGDIERVLRLLGEEEVDAATFHVLTFWGGLDYVVDGWTLRRKEGFYHRLFKWGPGYTYATHRPPTVLDAQGRDLRALHWLSGRDTQRLGIELLHYSMLFPFQVSGKGAYRRATPEVWSDAYDGWDDWFETAYRRLQRPYGVHYLRPRSMGRLRRLPSWLERYDGEHPAQVRRMMDDVAAGRLRVETRGTADVEALFDRWWYAPGRAALKALDYGDRASVQVWRNGLRLKHAPRRLRRAAGRFMGGGGDGS